MNRDRFHANIPIRVFTWTVALTLALASLVACGGAAATPTVSITSPSANATVEANVPMTIQGSVTGDNLAGANITRIEVVLDGLPLANVPVSEEARSASELPIQLEWTPTTAGAHFIQFNVYGPNEALVAKSDAIVFTVNVAQPTATLPSPTPEPTPLPAPTATIAPTVAPITTTEATTATTPATSTTGITDTTGITPPSGGVLETPMLTVTVEIVNVREGPGTNYPTTGQLQNGQTAPVKGKSADGTWWQIAFQAGNGWVFGELVQVNTAAQNVTVAQAPPVPTSAPVPTTDPAATTVAAAPTTEATAAPSDPGCNETTPSWRGANPNYPFCATQDPTWGDPQGDWNVYDNGKDIPLSISWGIFGSNVDEVRIHFTQSDNACEFARPSQRQVDQVVPATGTYSFNVSEFPGGGTFWVYLTVRLKDGRVVEWGQKKLCIR